MDPHTLHDLIYIIRNNWVWVLSLVGLIGILWRLSRIISILEQIRDQQPSNWPAPGAGDRPKRIVVPGLND